MSYVRRALARLRHRPGQQPWAYERLATPEEIAELTKTDMRTVA